MPSLKFSLIMATLGRSDEIIAMLDSLLLQNYTNFELIIVDQNEDDRVKVIYDEYRSKLDLRYFYCREKGLSKARNMGLKYITGNIVAFPDDDCEYEYDTLLKVTAFFEENNEYNFYTCNTKEKNGGKSVLDTSKNDCIVTVSNLMSVGISFTIFVRSAAIAAFSFDEQLGVGAFFGSGEESDLLLYLIRNNNIGMYHSGHFIYHPQKKETAERVYSYSLGFGAVYKKSLCVYRFYTMFFIFLYRILRNIGKLCLHPSDKTARYLVKGRTAGFLKYRPLKYNK